MTKIYVIDDDGNLRDTIEAALGTFLAKRPGPRPDVRTRDYIWRVKRGCVAERGDIAICDLYPFGFWRKAPRPRPEPVVQLPDDPRNMIIAVTHIINGYLMPMKKRGIRILVFSYVPQYLDDEGYKDEASRLRAGLTGAGLELLEKADRSDCPENLPDLVSRVGELLDEDAADDPTDRN